MGLFDVFKKKDCEICGKEVGMLGYKKLKDGEICKDCVKLLSPWFEDRRESTVAEIKEQLAYRERNAKELENFTVSRTIGESGKIHIEEVNGIPTRFFVTRYSETISSNPDIISFKDVISSVTDINVRDEEMKQKDNEGKMVSYNPPRFKHHYDFRIKMEIRNNPYFDHISFTVNRSVVTIETVGGMGGIGGAAMSGFLKGVGVTPMSVQTESYKNSQERRRYEEYRMMCEKIQQAVEDGKRGIASSPIQIIEDVQPQPAMVQSQAAVVMPPVRKAADNCPNCGAPYGAGKFCENCGTPKAEPKPAAEQGWSCFCGTVNTGKFCQNCGTPQFKPEWIWCSECSWTTEEEEDPKAVPKFCPNCGKQFDRDDIR